ncbi:MAG: orotidine 5'-phosphate decarboxylase [Candidatus Melainabacteria bacterium RIFCSPLOWO2_02_FULL_35_15]|nr:MAG: orotidine 5'-phosphate decarboxylase [Candidatus Melainabacteria bacterium RIFCSPLOWO2_12_FULL_35_11]OGI13917.1 MAG: orotidine 5'-phosphate decarboxylase [Candidatus Melainabacteria bacterium RIFCSPLOWO2_02_FULL_35_15]
MTIKTQAKDRLIVALDTSSENEAFELIKKLSGKIGYFKVGLELFSSMGPKIIDIIKDNGDKVFFDGKFLDIPNTVSKAIANIVKHKVDILNVYMSGGANMLQEAKKSLVETAKSNNLPLPKLLGVTVLTSMTSDVLENDLKVQTQLNDYVLHLAELGIKNGLDGIICSANEAKLIRDNIKNDFLIVTPGIRPSWAQNNDQKRIATPKEAIKNGVTHIVVGRPITGDKDPVSAAEKILEEIEDAIRV